MIEQPSTGDLHILTADSKVHVVRPSALVSGCSGTEEAIQPIRYTHPELRSSFWMGLSFSPCGRYLASGSSRGGVMTWDTCPTATRGYNVSGMRDVVATKIGLGDAVQGWEREREVNAVDWGYDMVSPA
jgi:denticleless